MSYNETIKSSKSLPSCVLNNLNESYGFIRYM